MTTKKDFIQAAKVVAELQDREEAKKVAKHFADMFYGQNNRFDYNRFYSACNVNMIKL